MENKELFANKKSIGEIDLGWQKADYVSPIVSEENDDKDADPSSLNFAWFRVESQIKPSDVEEQERIAAINLQFQNKIINKYGLPYGSPMPKEFKEIVEQQEAKAKGKGNKWDRKRKRIIDRQIEKDVAAQRKKESEVVWENPNLNMNNSGVMTPLLQNLVYNNPNYTTRNI